MIYRRSFSEAGCWGRAEESTKPRRPDRGFAELKLPSVNRRVVSAAANVINILLINDVLNRPSAVTQTDLSSSPPPQLQTRLKAAVDGTEGGG